MKMKTPYIIYSESTPNPNVMKFVSNKFLTNSSKEYKEIKETNDSTLMRALFTFPFVKEIFIAKNYISIKKQKHIQWSDVTNSIRIFIQDKLNQNITIQSNRYKKTDQEKSKVGKSKILLEIEKLIELDIRPNIQMDGGDIEVVSLKDGLLKVFLKGACSGCPSSQITLKNGIEVLLKEKFKNQITNVIAINN